MALTPAQANDWYIISSINQFLVRNVKTQYDAFVPTLTTSKIDISKPLLIMQGKPSDSAVALNPPSIGIEDSNGGSAFIPLSLGSTLGYRCMDIILYCYPAVNAIGGEPSDVAANVLKGYLRSVMQTVSFGIIDYGNPSCNPGNIIYCSDNAYIDKFTPPMNRAKSSPNALERNRFDMNFSICYPVTENLYH
jgi:hypothetical protein